MSSDVVIEAWNTVLFEKFSRFKYQFIEGYASISEQAPRRFTYPEGSHVVDIGCRFGECTIEIAKSLGASGTAKIVDCASNSVEECRKSAKEKAVQNANFFVADIEVDDLGGSYDEAFAHFGTMFFNLSGSAMRNIRQSLKPGGKFTQVVWRKREDNPWLHAAELCVRKILPVVSHEETDAVHCGPAPSQWRAQR
jgi:ubiquinone/menaquinone biosynthesis C-methylase UbiE